MANSKPFEDFREAVYDRSSPYNGDFSDSPEFITIFERGRKIKVYPEQKMMEILSENIQVFFDADTRLLAKYDSNTGEKLLVTASETMFYLKVFLQYLRGVRSWTPGARF